MTSVPNFIYQDTVQWLLFQASYTRIQYNDFCSKFLVPGYSTKTSVPSFIYQGTVQWLLFQASSTRIQYNDLCSKLHIWGDSIMTSFPSFVYQEIVQRPLLQVSYTRTQYNDLCFKLHIGGDSIMTSVPSFIYQPIYTMTSVQSFIYQETVQWPLSQASYTRTQYNVVCSKPHPSRHSTVSSALCLTIKETVQWRLLLVSPPPPTHTPTRMQYDIFCS